MESNIEEINTSESVELADLRRKYQQLQRSENLRIKALEENNQMLTARLADLNSENVRLSDQTAQVCKRHETIKIKNGNISAPKRYASENSAEQSMN